MPVRSTRKDGTKQIQAALMAWFKRNRRDLPWRRSRDPYAIWVSEIMLQQTRAGAAAAYFRRFLRRLPNVRALAGARIGQVLKAWEGLGYYARARNMHRAARQIAADFGGRLPTAPAELRKLPGIGRYTAGAIASIAFGLDEPVLDGNVTRVLCRLFRIREDPKSARTRKKLWSLARRLIPPGEAGLFNQAMMDLGAIVCIPSRPRCAICPLRRLCRARQHDEQDKLPRKAKRRPLPHETLVAAVIWKAGRILIDRRKDEGLLGGLWEFPGGKVEGGESLAAALRREVREELAVRVAIQRPLVTVEHAYTHFRITLHAFECRYVSGRPQSRTCAAWRWVRPEQLDEFAFPRANHKIIAALRERIRHASQKASRRRARASRPARPAGKPAPSG